VRLLDKFSTFVTFPATGFGRTKKITDIRPCGQRTVIALDTTSSTYIAEGLASHNCKAFGTRYARLYVFFVPEAIKAKGGALRAWDLTFTQRELDEEWDTIFRHARAEGLLK